MKAVRIFEHGGTEVLKYGDYPMPECGPSDVLVRVLATSLSLWDIFYRKGAWNQLQSKGKMIGRRMFPLPMQLGRDVVGVVEALGGDVTRFAVGQRVIGLAAPANPDCTYTIRGMSNLSTGIDIPGHSMFGGHAQYNARPQHYWSALPDGVDSFVAAAALWSYACSYRIVADRAAVKINDYILVTGGSGGMGSAAIELAKLAGATVIVTTRSASKVEVIKQIGADHVVVISDSLDQDVAQIRAITGGVGVDSAVEYTANPTVLRRCIDSVRLGGTVVVAAAGWTDDPIPVPAHNFIRGELTLKGVRGSTLDDQRIIIDLLAKRSINPRIHAILPMKEIAEAHELLERGEVLGRIILDPWQT